MDVTSIATRCGVLIKAFHALGVQPGPFKTFDFQVGGSVIAARSSELF